jgi:hypothetical protein
VAWRWHGAAWHGSDRMRRRTKGDRWCELARTVEARRTCGSTATSQSARRPTNQSAPLHRTGSRQRWQRSVLENAQLRCRTKGESTLVASLQRSTFKSRRQTVCNAGSVNKRSDARGTHRPRFSCCGVEACRLLAMNQLASRNVNGTPGNAPSLHWQALLFEALNSSM